MRPRRKTLALAPLCDVAVEADARAHVTVRRTKWDINKTQKQNFAAIGLARYPAASILPLLYSEWVARGAKSILTGMWGWWGMDGPYSDARVKGGRNRQVRTLALQVRVCVWLRALGWEQTSSRTSIRRWVRTHHGRNERDSLRAGGLSESVRRAACRQKKAKRLNSDGEEESEEEAEVLDGLDPSNQEATYKSDAYSGAFHYTRYRRRL